MPNSALSRLAVGVLFVFSAFPVLNAQNVRVPGVTDREIVIGSCSVQRNRGLHRLEPGGCEEVSEIVTLSETEGARRQVALTDGVSRIHRTA
jgi:hypothetical protein